MIYALIATMVLSVISTIIYLISIVFEDNDKDRDKDLKRSTISTFVWVICMVMIVFAGHEFENKNYEYPKEPTSIEYITALSDNQEINGIIRGSRYVMRGYFEEKLYYSYMVDIGNGGKKANKVPADNTIVYETDTDYRVEWYTGSKEFWGQKDQKTFWKIYLPKGSITDEYSIDLE